MLETIRHSTCIYVAVVLFAYKNGRRIKCRIGAAIILAFLPMSVQSIEKTEHLPLLVPISINGLGHSLGVGYAGVNLIDSADLTMLLFMGNMTGVSASFTDMVFVDDWFRLDSQLAYFSRIEPLSNYSRGSEASPKSFRPVIQLSTAQVTLTTQPFRFMFFKLIPGTNVTHFDFFRKDNRDDISTPSIHITNLDQPYITAELGLRYADKKDMNHISLFIRSINKSKSSGYSGDQITSYRLDGQYFYDKNSSIFIQYFHSDASVTDASDISSEAEVEETLAIDCAVSSTQDTCQKLRRALSSYIAQHNKYGTAEPLGGPERMKAYPVNYFRAARSRYLAVELRFDELDTIDDKSAFFHLFAEMAQVADLEKNLSAAGVHSNGFDLGVNINEDLVYKLTIANGDSGWAGHLTFARSW